MGIKGDGPFPLLSENLGSKNLLLKNIPSISKFVFTWNHLKSCRAKLDLFARQAVEHGLCHFPLLDKQKVPETISTKITDYLQSFNEEITRRFQDFQKINRY